MHKYDAVWKELVGFVFILTYKGLPIINDTSYLIHRSDTDGVGSEISAFNMWFGLSKFGRFGSRVYYRH